MVRTIDGCVEAIAIAYWIDPTRSILYTRPPWPHCRALQSRRVSFAHRIRAHYSFVKLRKDLLAGLTVSVVEVPQSMAYAMVAGVPPSYGLYTSIIQGVMGALLSSSEHVTTGPTNTQSLLIASTVSRFAAQDPVIYLQMVFALTLLKGLIQLAFAFGAPRRHGPLCQPLGDRGHRRGRGGVLIIASQLPQFSWHEHGQ